MRTEQIAIFKFEELPDSAKEKAREWYRNAGAGDQWWDGVYEAVTDAAKLMGVEIDNIGFSGFWSQGDGAHFTGSFGYAKGCVKAVASHAPLDEDLQGIAREWQALQARNFYKLSGTVKHSGHYQHENCTSFDVYRDGDWANNSDTEESVKEVMRDLMRWIYKRLETEWAWLNADEQVDACIIANEHEFTADGTIH